MNKRKLQKRKVDVPNPGMQDLLVDLLNSLSAIKALSEIKCEISDEKTLIRQALASLLHNQDMEMCSFFVLDHDGMLTNVTGLSAAEALEGQQWYGQALKFRVGEGVIGTAAASGQIQYCQNCCDDKRFARVEGQNSAPGSIVCVPVFTLHKKLIGVLNVSHPQSNFFNNGHLRLLGLYSNILGQLVTNHRLFQQMEAQIALRTSELERLVDETRALKDHYASMSMRDQLTGLYNRRYFYDQFELTIAQQNRYQNPFCLLVMDIDYFKLINDQHGHIFGDQVLVFIAESLKKQVRTSDILVRFGGEEFVVIFTNTGCDNGKVLAERIRQEIKSSCWEQDGKSIRLTLSIGVYCSDLQICDEGRQLDIDQIIHYADTACYAAKAKGRDSVVVYGENLPTTHQHGNQ